MGEEVGRGTLKRVVAFERRQQRRDFVAQRVVSGRCFGQKRVARRRFAVEGVLE